MEVNFPLVTFVVPCYNHERYVEETLNSILEEEYPAKEIVIINDGSTDGSDTVIKEWILKHSGKIRVIYKSRPNAGICATLNEIIKASSGQYLVIIASDDMIYPGSTGQRVDVLQRNPDKRVLISDAVVMDENGKVVMNSAIEDYNLGNKTLLQTDEGMIYSTLARPQISGPTVMVDRRIYDEVGMYRTNLKAEDWYFYQRAAARKLMIFDNRPSGKYRVHSTSTSGVALRGSLAMTKTIVLTYWYNWYLMPGIRFKALAVFELIKWVLRYILYSVRQWTR